MSDWQPGTTVRFPKPPPGVHLPNDRGVVVGADELSGKTIVEIKPPVREGDDPSRARPRYGAWPAHELIEVASL